MERNQVPQYPQFLPVIDGHTLLKVEIWDKIASIGQLNNRLDISIYAYEKSLEYDPSNIISTIRLAHLYWRFKNDLTGALKLYNYVLKIQENQNILMKEKIKYGWLYVILAHIMLMSKNYEGARNLYELAMETQPDLRINVNNNNKKSPKSQTSSSDDEDIDSIKINENQTLDYQFKACLLYGYTLALLGTGNNELLVSLFNECLTVLSRLPKTKLVGNQISEINFRLATILEQDRNYSQAIIEYSTLLRVDSSIPFNLNKSDICLKIGNLYEHMRNYKSSEQMYERSLKEDSNNFFGKCICAWIYHIPGTGFTNFDKTIEYAKSAIDQKESLNNYKIWYILGISEKERDELDLSLKCFNKCLEIASTRKDNGKSFQLELARMICSIGVTHFRLRNYEDALKSYTLALKKSLEKSWLTWYNIGLLYEDAAHQFEDAYSCYEKASKQLKLDPLWRSNIVYKKTIEERANFLKINFLSTDLKNEDILRRNPYVVNGKINVPKPRDATLDTDPIMYKPIIPELKQEETWFDFNNQNFNELFDIKNLNNISDIFLGRNIERLNK